MIHHLETQILILLLVACCVGIVARRLRLPYTLALIVAGLLLGFVDLPSLAGAQLSADLLLLLLLPSLLFEAAFHIEWQEFRREAVHILMLAGLGVLVAVSITGGLLYLCIGASGMVSGFELSHGFIFAALICATDPVSVLSLFRELGVPRRLYLLVEGESLLNDGVAVVVFFIVLSVVGVGVGGAPAPELNGASAIISHAIVQFVRMALGGALIGAIIGGGVSFLTRHLDDHLLEVTLTTLVAFGSFLLAETVHCSGVISTVVAGLIMGSVGATQGMSPHTKRAVEDFWEYMAFLANSFVFLLVGLKLDPGEIAGDLGAIVIAFIIVVGARAMAVYGLVPLTNRLAHTTVSRPWQHVMVWGGLRGSLSMVLVLTLPGDFPQKQFLVNLVFGVVAFSLFLQGLTVKPLLARLGLLTKGRTNIEYERARARVITATRALQVADELNRDGIVTDGPYERIKTFYEHVRVGAEAEAREYAGDTQFDEQLVEGMARLGEVEQETLRKLTRAGVLGEDCAADLQGAVIDRLVSIEHAAEQGVEELGRVLQEMTRQADSDDPVADAGTDKD